MKNIIFIIFAMFIACSNTKMGPLTDNGLSKKERELKVEFYGFFLTKEVKKNYLAGKICIGMTKDLIYELFGLPDSRIEDKWIYFDKEMNTRMLIIYNSRDIVQRFINFEEIRKKPSK